jgi:putative alpha-1,2-mannosidase
MKNKTIFAILVVGLLITTIFAGCIVYKKGIGPRPSKEKADFTKYVNPFIGTDRHGHTFPGACVPFGMVQLSPDTGISGWDWCSGYHYSDNSIIGFSHTHLSGTGCADYGDILFMPI